jgi:ABC-2 type transport system permease protein
MANFFNLLKVQFLSFLGLNKILHSKNKRKLSGIGGLIITALLIVGAIGFYAYTYADAFALTLSVSGNLKSLIPIMLGIGAIVSFMFSFYTTSSLLFGFKDYDMLSSMPIKSSTIVFSKLTFLYLSDLAFSLLFIIPSLVVYFGYRVWLSYPKFFSR